MAILTSSEESSRGGDRMKLPRRRTIARIIAGTMPVAAAVALIAARNSLTVKMRDDCDPATFNANVGPGTCAGKGDTTFQEFTAELAKEGQVGDWRLNPNRT